MDGQLKKRNPIAKALKVHKPKRIEDKREKKRERALRRAWKESQYYA